MEFLAKRLSPSMHSIYESYYKIAVIGAWEHIIIGGLIGLFLWTVGIYQIFSGSDDDHYWVGIIMLIGGSLFIVLSVSFGINSLLDTQYRVIQLLISTASNA